MRPLAPHLIVLGCCVAVLGLAQSRARATEPLPVRLAAGCAWLGSADAVDATQDEVLGAILDALRGQCAETLPASQQPAWEPAPRDYTLADELEALRAGLSDAIEPAAAPPRPRPSPLTAPPAPGAAPPVVDPSRPMSGVWLLPARKTIGAFVKRRLELTQDGKKVVGRMFEETWFGAPAAWVDSSCGGNPVFRMTTAAAVSGSIDGDSLVLQRERPTVASCTCGARCIPEKRRRGFAFTLVESGLALRDGDTVYFREGAEPATSQPDARAGSRGAAAVTPLELAGDWETEAYARAGGSVVTQLALIVEGERVTGTMSERTTQQMPLESWRDRFCEGAARFEYVDAFEVEGTRSGGSLALKFKAGRVLSCTCPSKCRTPKRRGMSLALGPTGTSLEGAGMVFWRMQAAPSAPPEP